MSYLLGITIGPVQTFIEESKKLNDLANSSEIIVEIMSKLYNSFKGSTLIYPQVKANQNASLTNYLIVEVDENKIDVSSLLDGIYKDLLEGKDIKIDDLKENFNCFWAYEEINYGTDEMKNNNEYKRAYNNLTHLISSLKNTYEFNNNIQESDRKKSDRKKCRLCGKRNIDTQRYKYDELCTLCGFKRDFNKTKFPSVYKIPAENILKENEKLGDNIIISKNEKYLNLNIVENLIEVFSDFAQKINGKNILNLDILNNSKYRKYRFEINKLNEFWSDLKKTKKMKLGDAIQGLKDLRKDLKDCYKEEGQPNFQYAFIKYDVDNLGKWLSGKFIDDDIDLKKFQIELSNCLCKFSEALKERIGAECTVIYSGGDDFLAICSCEKIFKIVNNIEEVFKNEVSDVIENYTFREISYSVSITIAQCKDPMSYSLRKNRVELENVKNKFEVKKNGVVLTYIVNNGKEICCYLRKKSMKLLERIIRDYKTIENNISLSYTRSFSEEFINICDNLVTYDKYLTIERISLFELRRVLDRSIKVKNELTNSYIDNVCSLFKKLYREEYVKVRSNSYKIDVYNIVNMFELINHLSKDEYYK